MRFLKHNIRDDFDDLTDVARLYGVRAVPCFVFFVGGAQVSQFAAHHILLLFLLSLRLKAIRDYYLQGCHNRKTSREWHHLSSL